MKKVKKNQKQSGKVQTPNTALHEAAHAVADVRFGFCSAGVNIIPREDVATLGQAFALDDNHIDFVQDDDGPVAKLNPQRAANRIIALLAGYVAEIERDPRYKAQAKICATSDLEKARAIVHELAGDRKLAPWVRKTRQFVRRNWSAIVMLENDLIETTSLDGTEVEAIVNIADGKHDEIEGLARYRALIKRNGTRQFPFKIVQE